LDGDGSEASAASGDLNSIAVQAWASHLGVDSWRGATDSESIANLFTTVKRPFKERLRANRPVHWAGIPDCLGWGWTLGVSAELLSSDGGSSVGIRRAHHALIRASTVNDRTDSAAVETVGHVGDVRASSGVNVSLWLDASSRLGSGLDFWAALLANAYPVRPVAPSRDRASAWHLLNV
jgi:hypothetical protein